MQTQMTMAALKVAEKVVKQEAARFRKFSTCSDTGADLAAEGLMRAVEAWATFDPTKGEWQQHCRMYVRLYQKRASNKAKSVVTTDYENRRIERDGAMVAQDEESGEWVCMDFADGNDLHARREAATELSSLYARFVKAAASVEEKYQPLALALIEVAFERLDADIKTLAEQHGVSRPTAYKVQRAVWAAAGVKAAGSDAE